MKFGIHNSSWLDGPDPAEAFEAVKAKAQWAEDHGFVWFSVLDHMIQIPHTVDVTSGRFSTMGTELRPALPVRNSHAPMPRALAPGAFLFLTSFPVALCHGSLILSQHGVFSMTPVSCGLMATPIRGERCPWPKS
jgi:hypothetical protein